MSINLPYLLPRIIRHFLPERLVRTLLLRGWIIKPSLETSQPVEAVKRYETVLLEKGLSLRGKRVMDFGYGGRFDTAVELLKRGAAHIVLCDKYAPPDETHNRKKFAALAEYFALERNHLQPRPEWITLLETDIREIQRNNAVSPVDIVLSNSVYEHLDDVEGITRALASLTKPDGIHVHFVDLRDHFFKYPFEMLRFSESTWRRLLNPSSNHNRYRLWNYRRVFETWFKDVEIKILARDEAAFRQVAPFVRPEFLSENAEENAVTLICIVASKPFQKYSTR